MAAHETTTTCDDRPGHEREQRPRSRVDRFATGAVAAVLIAPVTFSALAHAGRAGPIPQAHLQDLVVAAAESSGPLAEAREQFRMLQKQVVELGDRVIGRTGLATRQRTLDAIVNQEIKVKSEEAAYENAKLAREVAEIAIVEYTEGIYRQVEATLKGELVLAEAGPPRAEDWVEALKNRLAKTKEASTGSAPELAYEYGLESRISEFELSVPRKRLDLANAQAKLDHFLLFAKTKREKELRAEVENARSDELAKQAHWEHEKFKLKNLQEAVKHQDEQGHGQQVLAHLKQAVSIVEELNSKLARAEKDLQPAAPIRDEIAYMNHQLQAVIDDLRREDAAAQWRKLKPGVHAAALKFLGPQAR